MRNAKKLPTPEEYLKEYMVHQSVQRYVRQLKKKAASMENGNVPFDTLEEVKASLKYFCAFANRNPDELIGDAAASWRSIGTVIETNDLLDKFWEVADTKEDDDEDAEIYETQAKSSAAVRFSFIKSFYITNGISVTAKAPTIKTVRKNIIHLDNDMIRRIADVMPLQHASWFLDNNYMGLRIGGFTKLLVEDFQIENWTKSLPLYSVFISKQISGTFDYTAYIGFDAMMQTKTYFAKKKLQKHDVAWNFEKGYLTKKFKAYAYQAGVIDAPFGLGDMGEPIGLCMLGVHAQRRRRTTLQESVGTNRNWVDHLIGHIPKGANAKSYSFPEDATPEDLYNEVLKALPKLEIYGHHELSPTTTTVQLQRMMAMEQIKKLDYLSDEKKLEIENLLKNIRLESEMQGAIQNIMVVTRKIRE
jgi:hypothetical protein